jgi:hypothetical protein
MFIRKMGEWTVEEMANVVGSLLRLQPLPNITFDKF